MYTEGRNSSIDYFNFKLKFNLFEEVYSGIKTHLFSILKIDESEYTSFYNRQYDDCRRYTHNIVFKGCPNEEGNAKDKDCDNYYLIELSGDSCQYIRENNSSIKELIEFIKEINTMGLYVDREGQYFISKKTDIKDIEIQNKNLNNEYQLLTFLSAVVMRYDVCCDLVNSPFFNLEEIKDKINKHLYTSRFRTKKGDLLRHSHSIMEKYSMDWNFNEIDFHLKDNKVGYSVLWGSLPSIALNIYDKKAEVKFKEDYDLPFDEVLRIEIRFGSEKAEYNYLQMFNYLIKDDLDTYFALTLSNLLLFREPSLATKKGDYSNIRRNKVWSKWNKMLDYFIKKKDTSTKIKAKPKYPAKNPFLKTFNWLSRSAFRAIAKVLSLDTDNDFLTIFLRETLLDTFKKGDIDNQFNDELNIFGKDYNLKNLNLLQRWRLCKEKYLSLGGNENLFKMNREIYLRKFSKILPLDEEVSSYLEFDNRE